LNRSPVDSRSRLRGDATLRVDSHLRAREQLAARFEAEWEIGTRLTLEEAVALALAP
jgi:hypothetical protein